MPSTTVRITPRAHKALRELSKSTGKPMRFVIESALEAYKRTRFWDACDSAYTRLRSNPKQWAEVVKEREEWDATLSDGLDPY